uniref:C-type lectin domain-containing protein n=1 Tax=Acrobeloides nanus TaxID=290746 RepID=A0A914E4T4_9BILA
MFSLLKIDLMKNLFFFVFCTILIGTLYAGCPGNFAKFDNNCYHYVKIQAEHAEAQELCELVNATLASIHSKEAQKFIGTLFKGGPGDEWAWIGLTENLVFKWEDGSNPNWLLSQSSFQEKVTRCVQMWSSKNWKLQQKIDYIVSDCKAKSGGAICQTEFS